MTVSANTTEAFQTNAGELAARYDAIDSKALFAPIAAHVPGRPCRVLDIGAGTGRDARWFAAMGHRVTAVEPVTALQDASTKGCAASIRWVTDQLPDLRRLDPAEKFDLITLIGVWHLLEDVQRNAAVRTLEGLAAEGAKVILSLRQGPMPEGVPNHPTDSRLVAALFDDVGFAERDCVSAPSLQLRNRGSGVTWIWLVLQKKARVNVK